MADGNPGAAEVAAYYDRNTLRFLRFVGAGASSATLAAGLARYAFFANLIGGGSLHRGLASGAFAYLWLGFAHADAASPRAT